MSKRIPTLQDFFVCLRCQYRLRSQKEPRSGRRHPTAHPHPPSRRFSTGPSLRQEQVSSDNAATDNGSIERAPIRYGTQLSSTDQNYRRWNQPFTRDSLVSMLGEPAKVLILPDKEKRPDLDTIMARIHASGPDKNPSQEHISSSGMLEEMAAERGMVDIDEVCKNIESVKTSWVARIESSMSGTGYNDLLSRLHGGFTKQQLGVYLDRAGRDSATDVFDLNVEICGRLYSRSSWQLVEKKSSRRSRAPRLLYDTPEGELDEKDVSAKERQGLDKDTLARRILRQCWHLSPRPEDSTLGEVEIRLQKLDLDLILNHKRDILKLISTGYGSKVEARPEDRIIRVTSDYESCVDIIKLLVYTVENIEVSMVELHDGLKSPRDSTMLNDTALRQLEEYTSTLLRPQRNSRKLCVFYLGPDDADLLETRRLIHRILRPAFVQTAGLAWSNSDGSPSPSPIPVAVGSRFSLLDRNQQWSRWCCPHQTKHTENQRETPRSSVSAGPTSPAKRNTLALNTVKSFFKAPDEASHEHCSSDSPYWRPELEYYDSVTLGQVLFPAKSAELIARAMGRSSKAITSQKIVSNSLTQPREFLPLVPGLVRSFVSLGPLEKSEEVLQIRLSPSSEDVKLPVPVANVPNLEITIGFDHEDKTTSILSVKLVHEKAKDLLQPQNVVDLRFVRKRCVCAEDGSIDPCIASFVENSNLDIWGKERFKTPLSLSLSVPPLAIQAHDGSALKDPLLIDYTVFGLELRSTLTMPFQRRDAWPTLTYTSVEAGRIGGRRDELTLHNPRFARTEIPSTPVTSAKRVDNKHLSDDAHINVLLHKTAALIENIEETGERKTRYRDVRKILEPKIIDKFVDSRSFRKIKKDDRFPRWLKSFRVRFMEG